MLKTEKAQVVEEVKEALKDSDGFVLVDFKGLNVEQVSELRVKMREQSAVSKVVKNRLLKIALKDLEVEGMDSFLKENTMLIYSKDDIVSPLKPIVDFAKENELLKIKGGYISGDVCDAEMVKAISKLPGKKELISMIAGGMNAVVSKFAGSLNAIMTQFVGVIEAVENKKKEEA